MKHLLTLNDISNEELIEILDLADELKRYVKEGTEHHYLKGKTLAMIFSKESTRTRISFEVGMFQLGGHALYVNTENSQIGRGEPTADTAQVLSRFVDGIMIRTYEQEEVVALAKYGSVPVINGLTDLAHPCQVLADLQTIREHKKELKGLKLAYLGDGNNMAHSLLNGCAKVGMDVAIATPKGYECDDEVIEQAKQNAKETDATVTITYDPVEAVKDADVLYTDTWISMGQEREKGAIINTFMPYQINSELASNAKDDYLFMHCLPAYRGLEVTEEIIDGPHSIIFDEAENRLHAQKAVMVKLMK